MLSLRIGKFGTIFGLGMVGAGLWRVGGGVVAGRVFGRAIGWRDCDRVA